MSKVSKTRKHENTETARPQEERRVTRWCNRRRKRRNHVTHRMYEILLSFSLRTRRFCVLVFPCFYLWNRFRVIVSENVLGSDAVQSGVCACDCACFVVPVTE